MGLKSDNWFEPPSFEKIITKERKREQGGNTEKEKRRTRKGID